MRLRTESVEWREIEGEVVVLDLRSSTYLKVGGSGAELWPVLAEGATAEDLAARLVDAYGIEPDQARRDVDAFVDQVREQGLLEE